ncbi:MAG: c-type cytochrome [Nitrospiria bacterium]
MRFRFPISYSCLYSGFFFLLIFCLGSGIGYSSTSSEGKSLKRGKKVYERYCYGCHGLKGDGRGIYSVGLNPKPRDFTKGIYKWTSGPSGSLPTDLDLLNTISEGVHGTAMPPWFAVRKSDLRAVINYVKSFSKRFEKEAPGPVTFIYPSPPESIDLAVNGKALFEKIGCSGCHGIKGKGDGPNAQSLTDDWGEPIRPANFTRGIFKTGKESWKIFRTISNGIGGTPMPSFSDQLKPDEIWELVYYVRSLKE